MNKKAFFLTVEGIEGCGKSSVISFLREYFDKKGKSLEIFREPGSTLIGEQIRDILLDCKNHRLCPRAELLLYLAARIQLIEEKLKPALEKYDVVLCDRFFDSTLIYQGYALNLKALTQSLVKRFSQGIIPDLTILIDALPEEGLCRIKDKDRIESRPLEFHHKLRKGYLSLARKYPKRIKIVKGIGTLVDTIKSVEKILEKHKI